MSISRDKFIAGQADILDRYFALVPGEDEVRRRFERLALDTYECITGKLLDSKYAERFPGHKILDGPFFPYPSAFNFADYDRGAGKAAPPELRQRWQDWKREYALLLERQPVLELRDALHKISESNDSSSWPQGLEGEIADWIDGGDRYALPFGDRYGVATPEFYQRLCQLRQRVGGWLYWDETKWRIVFAKEDDWLKVRKDQAAAWERNMQRIHGAAWPRLKPAFEEQRAKIAEERRKHIEERRQRLIALEAEKSAPGAGSPKDRT